MRIQILHPAGSAAIANHLANLLRSQWPSARIEVKPSGLSWIEREADFAQLVVIVQGTSPEETSAAIVAIRQASSCPLVVYAPEVAERQGIAWLELGADEVVASPSALMFLAIVHALVRRTGDDGPPLDRICTIGDLTMTVGRHEIAVNDHVVKLTPTEFRLFEMLTSRIEFGVTGAELMQQIWGVENPAVHDALKVHISHLRHKLKDAGSAFTVVSEWGRGYRLAETGPTATIRDISGGGSSDQLGRRHSRA